MDDDDKWAPGTGIIIVLLLIIADKLHAFDGLFASLTDPTRWVITIALIAGIGIAIGVIAIIWRIFRGFGGDLDWYPVAH
jgi:hypothetical protein